MNIPGKIASSTLILIGLAWLLTVFLNPRTWATRSANQINGTVQNGATTQNFTAPKSNVPLADGTQVTIDQGTLSTESTQSTASTQQRVPVANQTVNTPNQAAQQPAVVATPTPTPAVTPQPAVVATPAPTPSPKVIAEPVRAGW